MITEKYKKTWKYLNYDENLLILISTITGYVSISILASLLHVSVGIASSAITAGVKKYKSIIN